MRDGEGATAMDRPEWLRALRVENAEQEPALADGHDALWGRIWTSSHGLTCRVYRTPEGLAGSPTVAMLRQALTGAE